jgi:hypothetical protein
MQDTMVERLFANFVIKASYHLPKTPVIFHRTRQHAVHAVKIIDRHPMGLNIYLAVCTLPLSTERVYLAIFRPTSHLYKYTHLVHQLAHASRTRTLPPWPSLQWPGVFTHKHNVHSQRYLAVDLSTQMLLNGTIARNAKLC